MALTGHQEAVAGGEDPARWGPWPRHARSAMGTYPDRTRRPIHTMRSRKDCRERLGARAGRQDPRGAVEAVDDSHRLIRPLAALR